MWNIEKRTIICAAGIALLISTLSSHPIEAAATNRQAIYTAQADFMRTNKLNKEDIGQSYRYDINNDGKDEIVISGWNRQMGSEAVSVIAVYSPAGKQMSNQRLNNPYGSDYWLLQTRRIHNPTHKNVLAAEYVGGATGGSLGQVFIWKNNQLSSILTTEKSETGLTFKDLNGDKNEEIIGKTPYGGKPFEGSYHSAPLHKFVYKWNPSKKEYSYNLYLNE